MSNVELLPLLVAKEETTCWFRCLLPIRVVMYMFVMCLHILWPWHSLSNITPAIARPKFSDFWSNLLVWKLEYYSFAIDRYCLWWAFTLIIDSIVVTLQKVLLFQNGKFAYITVGKLGANFVLGVAVAMCLSSFAFYVYTMLQRWPIKVIHSTPSKSDTKNGYHQQKTWATTTILCSNTTIIGTLLLTSTYYVAAINDIHTRESKPFYSFSRRRCRTKKLLYYLNRR